MNKKENIFFLFILTGLFFSIINSFYQVEFFDNFRFNSVEVKTHSMVTGDILSFWREGFSISNELKSGKSYFETGGEYGRPYLPSRIYTFFSIILSQDLMLSDGSVSLEFNKTGILITQTVIYYLLITWLYFILINYLPKNISKVSIIFLAFEPTLFMYHSSLWSESIFFSLQLLLLILVLFKNQNYLSAISIGLVLGILYLQRSVAIFYVFPVLIYFYIKFRINFYKHISLILMTLFFVHAFVGFHNYQRMGIFYTISTQAKAGFYDYLLPEIISKKENISQEDAKVYLQKETKTWLIKNNLSEDLIKYNDVNEKNRLKYFNYIKNYSTKVMIENPIITLKIISKRTLHFFVIDPLTHVYYFHRWDNEIGYYQDSEVKKKLIFPRIVYSLLIYFFVFLGIYRYFKSEKDNKFFIFLILSIIYFTAIQSWFGSTRYFAPILIYLSFPFSYGLVSLISSIKSLTNK